MSDLIKVNVALYGKIAQKKGGKNLAQFNVELPSGSSKADLYSLIGITPEERGFAFITAVLCDMPGLITDGGEILKDGDHVGIFSVDYMWPYQYRDGVRMSENLKKALHERGELGAMHHTYKDTSSGH